MDRNTQRIYNVCVVNPIETELPTFLKCPPSIAVPEAFIAVESLQSLKCGIDIKCVAKLIAENYFSNEAASRLLTNLRDRVRDEVFSYLYPESDSDDDADSSSESADDDDDDNDVDESEDEDSNGSDSTGDNHEDDE